MIILLLLLLFVSLLIWGMEGSMDDPSQATLEKDGFIVVSPQNVLNELPKGYVFLDYIYTIDGCSLSTFHRDVTSSQYVFETTHPVYTFITYEYNGGAPLSLCPGSHKTVPMLYSSPKTVNATSVLFNCDLVHAGTLNTERIPRKAVQYKLAHKDDLEKLKHLQGIRKYKYGDCRLLGHKDVIYRLLSLHISYPINHLLTPYLQERKNNTLCKIIGEDKCFYNA